MKAIEKHIEKIFKDVLIELKSANKKFPNTNHNTIALMEEVGEFAQAILHLEEKSDSTLQTQTKLRRNVYNEGIQSISMILKLMTRGDSSTVYKGIYCEYAGCEKRELGGPCPICYE
jgi:hypothetical protein